MKCVYPNIPNNIIIEALDNVGIKITSYTPALNGGFQLDKFSYIKSFH